MGDSRRAASNSGVALWDHVAPLSQKLCAGGLAVRHAGLVMCLVVIPSLLGSGTCAFGADLVAWEDGRSFAQYGFDIYGYDPNTGQEIPICTNVPKDQADPAVSGDTVVWCDWRNDNGSTSNADIYGFRLPAGDTSVQIARHGSPSSQFAICTAPGLQMFPAIFGNIVVWQDSRNMETSGWDIYGYDLATGEAFPVCTAPGNQTDPAISGSVVVWTDERAMDTTGSDIWGLDLGRGEELAICVEAGSQSKSAIDGDLVVWEDWRNFDASGPDIYGRYLSVGRELKICAELGSQRHPSVSDSVVAWEDWRNDPGDNSNSDVYCYDLADGVERAVSTSEGHQYCPAISGDTIVWEDWRAGRNSGYDVRGYDLSAGQDLAICSAMGSQGCPTLEYRWIPPDPPVLMGRNFTVRLHIENPDETDQAATFAFSQDVLSHTGSFSWDEGWQESMMLDGSPYAEGSTQNVVVPGTGLVEHQFSINNKWNWIEPYVVADRLFGMCMGLLLSFPGLEVASLTVNTITALMTYVPHVGSVTYTCEGVGGSVTDTFTVALSVPWEKHVFFGESVVAGMVGGKATSAGILALFVPGVGWAAAGPLFALEAISIGAGEVAYAIAVDPDPDYMQIASPEPIAIPPIEELEEGSGRQAAMAELKALSYLQAALASYARYETAEDAEDAAWMAIQLELTNWYLSQAASLLAQVCSLLEPVVAGIPVPSPEQIEELRAWIAANGLPQIEVDVLLALGFSQEEIDGIAEEAANMPDAAFTQFPDLPQAFCNMAEGLELAAAAMPLSPEHVLMLMLDVHPEALNLRSWGQWVTCYIELPEGYSVADVDVGSLRLQGVIPCAAQPVTIGDYDSDGIPDLMVKFDRSALCSHLTAGEERVIFLMGELQDGAQVVALDLVRVLD